MTDSTWGGEPCITHSDKFPAGDRPRRCYRRGLHFASCENQDPPEGEKKCRGCVPRSQTDGLLCPVCAAQVRDAIPRVARLIAHLRSVEKNPQAIGERVATSMERSILFPDTWAAADGLLDALGAPPFKSTHTIDEAIHIAQVVADRWTANLDEYINTEAGARRAVILVKRMKVALERWPESETEWRAVPHVACPGCRRLSLFRRAPLEYGDDLLILCATTGCGYKRDWFEWVDEYAPAFAAIEKQQKKAERAARAAEKARKQRMADCPHGDDTEEHEWCWSPGCDGQQCVDVGHCDAPAQHDWPTNPEEDWGADE